MNFTNFLSSGTKESSKRLGAIFMTANMVMQQYLFMYIKIEIANKGIVKNLLWYEWILTLALWGFVTVEWLQGYFEKKVGGSTAIGIAKAQNGVPEVTNQVVQEQNVNGAAVDGNK